MNHRRGRRRPSNGFKPKVLDQWSQITKLKRLNATDFMGPDAAQKKNAYASPHAVGCYLSHWRLLEQAWKSWGRNKRMIHSNSDNDGIIEKKGETTTTQQQQQQQQQQPPKRQTKHKRPDMLFVFEEDAHCVSNLIDRTWSVVRQLPKDWDILFVGGKPMSYYTMGNPYRNI
mmetsp:Transcript_21481/g.43635  ORF Transcript_21481/g.43635 Transcript_21481/m.43635 type:complete len:172 (-) Transcript_21481:393-908(-)